MQSHRPPLLPSIPCNFGLIRTGFWFVYLRESSATPCSPEQNMILNSAGNSWLQQLCSSCLRFQTSNRTAGERFQRIKQCLWMDINRRQFPVLTSLHDMTIKGNIKWTEIQEYSKIYLTILSVYNIVIVGIISKKYKVQMDMTKKPLKESGECKKFLSKPKFEPLLDFLRCF